MISKRILIYTISVYKKQRNNVGSLIYKYSFANRYPSWGLNLIKKKCRKRKTLSRKLKNRNNSELLVNWSKFSLTLKIYMNHLTSTEIPSSVLRMSTRFANNISLLISVWMREDLKKTRFMLNSHFTETTFVVEILYFTTARIKALKWPEKA